MRIAKWIAPVMVGLGLALFPAGEISARKRPTSMCRPAARLARGFFFAGANPGTMRDNNDVMRLLIRRRRYRPKSFHSWYFVMPATPLKLDRGRR